MWINGQAHGSPRFAAGRAEATTAFRALGLPGTCLRPTAVPPHRPRCAHAAGPLPTPSAHFSDHFLVPLPQHLAHARPARIAASARTNHVTPRQLRRAPCHPRRQPRPNPSHRARDTSVRTPRRWRASPKTSPAPTSPSARSRSATTRRSRNSRSISSPSRRSRTSPPWKPPRPSASAWPQPAIPRKRFTPRPRALPRQRRVGPRPSTHLLPARPHHHQHPPRPTHPRPRNHARTTRSHHHRPLFRSGVAGGLPPAPAPTHAWPPPEVRVPPPSRSGARGAEATNATESADNPYQPIESTRAPAASAPRAETAGGGTSPHDKVNAKPLPHGRAACSCASHAP